VPENASTAAPKPGGGSRKTPRAPERVR
jgi:hypothetical protein